MNNGIIITKKTTWTSKVEVDYLDELSSKKQQQLREKAEVKTIGEKLKQFNAYADKDNLGRVYVGGFFHREIAQNPDGTFTAPANLPKVEIKARLLKTWQQHLQVKGPPDGIVQHRFVISMSQPQHDLLVKYGLNPDTVLHERVRLVMKEFREKFHAGDSVGYAYGLHHDTDHLHAHVAVCPRSEKQQRVGLSEQLRGRKSKSRHKNQLAFVKQVCERENEKLAKSFATFEGRQRLLEQLRQGRNAEAYFYMKSAMPQPLPGTADQRTYHQLKQEREQMTRLRQEIKTRQTILRDTGAAVANLPLLLKRALLPREFNQADRIAASLLTLFTLSRQLGQSHRALSQSRHRYFRLHQTYYHPIRYAINTRIHHQKHQHQSLSQIQPRQGLGIG